MLSHLHIRDFAIIPSLALDFRAGFTAITGETGAGKSILVDALGLLLGERSDASWVRQGAEKAELTAEFLLNGNPAAAAWLENTGLDSAGQCLLRRSIAAGGRSRAWINGTPVTLQQLGELGNLLVEIHGQNEHMRLKIPAQQFQLLDGSGDYGEQLSAVSASFGHWKNLRDEFHRLERQSGITPAELDYLKFQYRELETHALPASAVFDLEREHRRLAHGDALREALDSSSTVLESEDHGSTAGIQKVLGYLQPLGELDPKIDEAARMLTEAVINCQEAAVSIKQAGERIDLSPERLAAVTDQLGLLADLARKHQVPMEDLERVRDDLDKRLAQSENFETLRTEMEAQRASALASYRACAVALSGCRVRQAAKLSRAVSELMSELGMPGGILAMHVRHDGQAVPSSRGDDDIELLVSANPGFDPAPLAKIASGGELSRLSLAIKVAASLDRSARTQIFDEVDAGIGGDTANAVGRLMKKLAGNAQALCVTHLAQVAVCADQQLQVKKKATKNQTSVDSTVLEDTERVDEIARMLGGRVSDKSRRHAAEMLSAALKGSGSIKSAI